MEPRTTTKERARKEFEEAVVTPRGYSNERDHNGLYVQEGLQAKWRMYCQGFSDAADQSGANSRILMDPRNSRPMVTSQMKADCIGEFEFTIQAECGECIDTGADEDCEVCQGGIQYERKVTVPWDTCKQIYKRMAESAIKSGGL